MKKLILLTLLLFVASNIFAHKEWVHQFLVGDGFKYMESKYNSNQLQQIDNADLLDLKAHIFKPAGGTYGWTIKYDGGNNNQPWEESDGLFVTLGAWQEDWTDPIWGYENIGPPLLKTATVSHFWKADDGDTQTNSFPSGVSNVPNAWAKAKLYLFGGWGIKLSTGVSYYYNFGTGDSYTYYTTRVGEYNSLVDFHKNNKLQIMGQWVTTILSTSSGTYVSTNFNLFPTPYDTLLNVNDAHKLSYNILGRVAHLLEDMNVPAHAHGQTHACAANLPEDYELFMGGNTCACGTSECPQSALSTPCSGSCNTMNTLFPAQGYSFENGFNGYPTSIDDIFTSACLNDEDAIRSLFYITNQWANFFTSGSNYSQASSPTINGNVTLNNQGNVSSSEIALLNTGFNNIMSNHGGNLPTAIDVHEIAQSTFPYVVRSTAALFYWFLRRLHEGGSLTQQNIVLQNQTISTPVATFQAIQDITAQNVGINCSANSSPVVFLAGNSIHLSNFNTNGCSFQAKIRNCNINNLRVASPKQDFIIPPPPTIPGVVLSENPTINGLSISPNPFTQATTIQFSNPSNLPFTLEVFDITGRLVVSEPKITGYQYTLQRNTLAEGVYLIKLKSAANNYFFKTVLTGFNAGLHFSHKKALAPRLFVTVFLCC